MKKFWILFGLFFVSNISAQTVQEIIYRDSVAAADTVGAGTVVFDTTLHSWKRIDGINKIHVYAKLIPTPGVTDTNLTNDTFFVNLQFSNDESFVMRTAQLDTLLTTDSGWTGNDLIVADSLRGLYIRVMLIHNAPKRAPGFLNQVSGKTLKCIMALVK